MEERQSGFEKFKLNKQLLRAIEGLGYQTPTPVQEKALPRLLAGQDLIGIAPTGTGKTAAYLLPILMKVKYAQGAYPRALILAPTRELVMQIDQEVAKLGSETDIRHVCLYGGLGPKTQKELLAKGADIITGTPGRVMELYLNGDLVLKQLQVFVLDEADRMMDMGFMPQLRKFLEVLPRKRQNVLFSATFPPKVEELSWEFLEYPERVEVAPSATPPEKIEQYLYKVPNFKTKVNLLLYLLQNDDSLERIMVFTRTKEIANNIYKFLVRKEAGTVRVIHANKGQNSRINAMDDFRLGDVRILIATDVAARGIDISLVTHVVNFDVPIMYEDYVHRIGRTGRAEHEGTAFTFCNPAEEYHIAKIEGLIRMEIPLKNLPADLEIEATGFEEKQLMARQIDNIRRKHEPDYQGAFHEKKKKIYPAPTKKRTTSIKKKKR